MDRDFCHDYKFQSTLPSRGATEKELDTVAKYVFQSTLPSRGATKVCLLDCVPQVISIHAPLAGSDWAAMSKFFADC